MERNFKILDMRKVVDKVKAKVLELWNGLKPWQQFVVPFILGMALMAAIVKF